jgi:hypothetical protein
MIEDGQRTDLGCPKPPGSAMGWTLAAFLRWGGVITWAHFAP